MPEETTLEDLDIIKGSPRASGVLRDVLPDVPRSILSRDEAPFLLVGEGPVSRKMKTSQDNLKKFRYTPNCANWRKRSHNEQSHPSLAQSQGCRTRIEAGSRTDSVHRHRAERVEKLLMELYYSGEMITNMSFVYELIFTVIDTGRSCF